MRNGENIRALEKLDIDWMGFIFYSRSPRCVPNDADICEAIQTCSKIKIGVFVNAKASEILHNCAMYRLDYVQLHGDEPPDFCLRLRNEGCAVIKAFSLSSENDLTHTSEFENFANYFLFDTKTEERGGSGKCFNWSILEAYRGETPFLLSGGIAPEHIGELKNLRHKKMAGIDLNSRFELAPGMKNIEKIEHFITRVK